MNEENVEEEKPLKPLWLRLKEFSESIAGVYISHPEGGIFPTESQTAWNCVVWYYLSDDEKNEIRQAVKGRQSANETIVRTEIPYNGFIKFKDDNKEMRYIDYLADTLMKSGDIELKSFGYDLSHNNAFKPRQKLNKLSITINNAIQEIKNRLELRGLIIPSDIHIQNCKSENQFDAINLSLSNAICLREIYIANSDLRLDLLFSTFVGFAYIRINDSVLYNFHYSDFYTKNFMHFYNVQFHIFYSSKVKGNSEKSIFNDNIVFDDCIFHYDAHFENCIFNGYDISYKKCKFLGAASFTNANFNGQKVSFSECEFQGYARFDRTSFNQCSFLNTKFIAEADFTEAIFKDHSSFEHTVFERKGDFTNCLFQKAPLFRKTNISHAYFSESSFSSLEKEEILKQKSTWYELILLAEKAHDPDLRQLFFKYFLQASNNKDFKAVYSCFDWTYFKLGAGISITKPMLGWFFGACSCFSFMLIIYWISWCFDQSFADPWKDSIVAVFKLSFPFISITTEDKLFKAIFNSWIFLPLYIFYTIWNITIFFIIGLGLRHRYRIK